MDFFVSCALCFVFSFFLIQAFQLIGRGRNSISGKLPLPPGPAPLPIIGNLLALGDKPHKSLTRLAKIHGPLISLKLGQVTTIVISSSSLAREVMQKHDLTFSNRTVPDAIRANDHHQVGLPWIPVGPLWRNLRKISNTHLFATQKLDMNQDLRRRKIQELLTNVQECCQAGSAMDIGKAAFRATLNALSSTIFSLDLTDSSSEVAQELKDHFRCIMVEAGKSNLVDCFPVLRKIDPQGIRRRMAFHFGKVLDLCERLMNERMKLRESEGYVPSNDMMDTLLKYKEENGQDLDKHQVKHLFLVLFVAGTDTTSSTLEWAMAELLRNPGSLSKVRAELEQTIGKGKLIEESDVARLPYLQAVIKETLRLHPAVPLLLPRKAGADVEMCGFLVPKDAQVMVNVWAMGRDPSTWKDPDLFFPERFLGSEIDFKGQNFELLPFGAGRRICPGYPLAVRMLYLILGCLINCFDWKLADDVVPEEMDMEDRFGLSLQKDKPLKAVPIPI